MVDKMEKVAAVAKVDEQQSAIDFSASAQTHAGKRQQLDQLLQFKADYESMLATKSREGITASQLQDYRLFLAKLNQAIEQQTQVLKAAEAELAEVRSAWIDKSQRKSALEHLVEERQKAQRRLKEKAEQAESDERAMTRPPPDEP
jgi:flagellar FliJ protein